MMVEEGRPRLPDRYEWRVKFCTPLQLEAGLNELSGEFFEVVFIEPTPLPATWSRDSATAGFVVAARGKVFEADLTGPPKQKDSLVQ